MITIRHTHEDGTLIHGTSKGDGVYGIVKPFRFRYFPSIRMIGIAQSRDHLAKRWQIDSAAEALRAAGYDVTTEIDDTPRDVAEVKADRAERLDARADRLTAASQRAASEAESRFAAADHYAERFAGGQPILVDHHSERSARADHKRMDGHMRAGIAAADKAERVSRAASVVGSADAYRERPGVIIRRIDRLEAELRQTMHYINGTRPANDWRGAYYAPDRKPASGEYLAQLEARKTFLEHQLAADRAALAEHEANGYVRHTRETIHKGDTVTWSVIREDSAVVTRTNPKTVTLDRRSWPRTLPYEQIRRVECPHARLGDPEPSPVTPAPEPAPARYVPPALALPDLAARAAGMRERAARGPLAVDARSQCFTTPPAIVARMIEAADLRPGLDVLEPSAGTGAIVSPVAALGCHVYCVEIAEALARVLDELPALPRSVVRADFLSMDPREFANRYGWPFFDRVLMNPPFSGQADIRHVTHALGFLKPGGRLVAVMSAGAEFRHDKTAEAFRKLVADCGGSIERLPDDAFKGSGTEVRTIMAVLNA